MYDLGKFTARKRTRFKSCIANGVAIHKDMLGFLINDRAIKAVWRVSGKGFPISAGIKAIGISAVAVEIAGFGA